MAVSVEHDDVPEVKKVVRGELIIGGWILDPDPEDEDKCYAYYIVQGDPKGSIPKWVVNMGAKSQGFIPYNINKAMHKHYD